MKHIISIKQDKLQYLEMERKRIERTIRELQEIKGRVDIGNRLNDLISLKNRIIQEKADEVIRVTLESRKAA